MPAESLPRSVRPDSSGPRRLLFSVLLLSQVVMTGCFGGKTLGAQDQATRQAEIKKLEASIAQDRAELADLVATPRDLDRNPLHDDARLRTLATRLQSETARLERLEAEAASDAAQENRDDGSRAGR